MIRAFGFPLALLIFTGCASTPVTHRDPSSLQNYPVRLICAGPAEASWVFGFLADPSQMSIQYIGGPQEAPTVAGLATVSLRGDGAQADFEHAIPLRGQRSPDGRFYHLVGTYQGQAFSLDLINGGTGTLSRTWLNGEREPLTYLSRCADHPG